MQEYLVASLTLLILAYAQNVSFSIVSRSRNRNNMRYHLIAAFFSNTLWFLTFRELVTAQMTLTLFPWYCVGTMLGSVTGVRISMWIETRLHCASDDHIKPKVDIVNLEQRVKILETRFPERFFVNPNEQPITGGLIHN